MFDREIFLASLRENLSFGTQSKFATICASVSLIGLGSFLAGIPESVRGKGKAAIVMWLGLIASAGLYMSRAGRQGLPIAIISCGVMFAALRQSGRLRDDMWRQARLFIASLATLFTVYIWFNSATRSTEGWLENKIAYFERNNRATFHPRFTEMLRNQPALGSLPLEVYTYFTPQIYGLDFALHEIQVQHTYGAVHLAPFVRRLTPLISDAWLMSRLDHYDGSFRANGLFANFFRTAVDSTFLEFGKIFGILFIFMCGLMAGRLRRLVITNWNPIDIAIQALVCSGAFMSNIYSAFFEIGWAYPFWFLLFIKLFFHMNKNYQIDSTRPSPAIRGIKPA